MDGIGNRTSQAPSSNKTQIKRTFKYSEIGKGVRQDDTTNAEKRGDCFVPSARERILGKNHGFGEAKPTVEDHTSNKGLNTLTADHRSAPLAGTGSKIELDQMRNYEHKIQGTPLVTDGKTTSYLK